MNRRAFLSRLVAAPMAMALPVALPEQARPSLLIPKLDQPVSHHLAALTVAIREADADIKATVGLWHGVQG